jgi:hypothetical protein
MTGSCSNNHTGSKLHHNVSDRRLPPLDREFAEPARQIDGPLLKHRGEMA